METLNKVCVMVCSHNNKMLTNQLCEKIIENTKGVPYDLHVVETGSDPDNRSSFETLWVKDKCRMTRGFNFLKAYADKALSYNEPNSRYDAYITMVNDAFFLERQDMISTLYRQMKEKPDCGLIHPYQTNINGPSALHLARRYRAGSRAESFFEFICPMIKAECWTPGLFDDRYFYGWGLDYDIPYQLHKQGMVCFISDEVGVYHNPFTSYRDRDITKEKLTKAEFVVNARLNMNAVLQEKYGRGWMDVLVEAVPVHVDRGALLAFLL